MIIEPNFAQPLIIENPDDLLVAIPFILGFHPEDSLVVLCLSRERNEIILLMRSRLEVEDPVRCARVLVDQIQASDGEVALVVTYESEGSEQNSVAPLTRACLAEIAKAGVTLGDSIFVRAGWWRSGGCASSECCNPQGNQVPKIEDSRIAAECVLRGYLLPVASEEEFRSTLAYRGALASVEPLDVEISPTEVGERAREVRTLWCEWKRSQLINTTVIGRTIASLAHIRIRDFALTMHHDDELDSAVALWRYLLTMAPTGHRAPVAALLAAASLEAGDGVLSRLALEEAFLDDPNYSLAKLLRRTLNAGWPGTAFAQMRADLRDELAEVLAA